MEMDCKKNIKEDICRDDFKNNILKDIIMRFDYSKITDIELQKVIDEISPWLKDKGYSTRNIERNTEINFQIEDPDVVMVQGLKVMNSEVKDVYVFKKYKNEESCIKLKISNTFAFIEIKESEYVNFFEYQDILLEVLGKISSRSSFYKSIRFGLRKVNKVIIKEYDRIENYFEKEYFPTTKRFTKNNKRIMQLKECYTEKEYNINSSRSIIVGNYLEKEAYQIILDTDIYMYEEDNINTLIEDKAKIKDMNEILFNIFKEALTVEFINELQKEKFDNKDEIIGVESNGTVYNTN